MKNLQFKVGDLAKVWDGLMVLVMEVYSNDIAHFDYEVFVFAENEYYSLYAKELDQL